MRAVTLQQTYLQRKPSKKKKKSTAMHQQIFDYEPLHMKKYDPSLESP